MHGGCVASLILRSLNHDFTSVVDVDALLRRLATKSATVDGVPSLTPGSSPKGEGSGYPRLSAAEVQHEFVDARIGAPSREAVEFELGALGTDAGSALRIVERIVGTEVEDGRRHRRRVSCRCP